MVAALHGFGRSANPKQACLANPLNRRAAADAASAGVHVGLPFLLLATDRCDSTIHLRKQGDSGMMHSIAPGRPLAPANGEADRSRHAHFPGLPMRDAR